MLKASGIKPNQPDRELDRRIAALALPALGSIAAEPAYSLADTAIVGHLGRVPLDSLAIATTALNMTAWVAIFLATRTDPEPPGPEPPSPKPPGPEPPSPEPPRPPD